ncbi:MAG: 30S ribosomal protein S17 [Candidatus Magasanikbacteria bacterium]
MIEEKKTTEKKKILKRRFEGEVVGVSADKTASVLVAIRKMHPKYRKQYTITRKYAVHDEKNEAKISDKIIFEECRPLSRTKRWRIVKIIK